MVQYLLSLPDIDVNAGNYIGQTALIFAAYHGQLELVQHLVEHGGNINSIDDEGELPWFITGCHGSPLITMGYCGLPRVATGCHYLPRVTMSYCGLS